MVLRVNGERHTNSNIKDEIRVENIDVKNTLSTNKIKSNQKTIKKIHKIIINWWKIRCEKGDEENIYMYIYMYEELTIKRFQSELFHYLFIHFLVFLIIYCFFG